MQPAPEPESEPELEAEIIIKRIKDLAIKEEVEHIGVSVSFGWETKRNEDEDVQEVFKNAEDFIGTTIG